jgi:hypothetical protein
MAGREKYHHYKRLFCRRACKPQGNGLFIARIGFTNSGTIKQTDRILRNNRLILQNLFLTVRKPFKISKTRFTKLAFSFDFCTGVSPINGGIIYHCYEYYYLAIDEFWYTIGRQDSINSKINFTYVIEKPRP